MPKVAMDYNNTIIYKIVCNDLNITDCYVGHTTNFTQRKYCHKICCNNISVDYYVYQFIRDNGGWDNWSMIEIEKYPCNDIYEALKRERYWIEELKSTLNKIIPTRTNKEYREINKDKMKEYREINKDKIKEYEKKYSEQTFNLICSICKIDRILSRSGYKHCKRIGIDKNICRSCSNKINLLKINK